MTNQHPPAVAALAEAAPKRSRRRWSWRARVAIALVLVLAAGCLFHAWLLPWAPRFLDVSTPPAAVDAVVVLGGGPDIRPFAGAEMRARGLAKRVILLEIEKTPGEEDGDIESPVELARGVMALYGVSDDDIVVLRTEVQSTRDEARSLARYLAEHPTERVAIVSHAYHTRRVRMIFRDTCRDSIDRLSFLGVPLESCREDDWWHTPVGWHTYMTEYMKLALCQFGLDA